MHADVAVRPFCDLDLLVKSSETEVTGRTRPSRPSHGFSAGVTVGSTTRSGERVI